MSDPEMKQLVEHLLDMVRRAPTSWKASGLSMPVFLAMSSCRLHTLLLACIVRPDVVRGQYPDLWEQAKDFLSGIRSGALPTPWWWDAATEFSNRERSGSC